MARSGYVDERIVEMQFDNQQFEKNANQSISTLDKLKQSLNLDGAAKGFDELDQKAKGIDFSTVQEGIAAIGDKFSMMGMLGFTAMQRISNSLIDMGMNLSRTLLGLDGISVGFDRYAEKSGHVKTIMTATGESIENVSEVLDDLNWFTDETSYAFTDMVNTMGKFTSAGVKLGTAKEAVEGIALWAAESGQNAQTASRAMFQLSQAYGRGTIQLQDWMSVEQANMSTQKIQNELIKEGGEAAKSAIAKYGGFRDSLRSGWLTTEVFNKVMQKYSEGVTEANYSNGKFTGGVTEMSEAAFKAAQEARTYKDAIDAVKEAVSTGWSQSFELMFGNAEESAIIWTDLANALIGVADKFTAFRNDVLEVWNDIGGRDKMVDAAYKTFSGIGKIGNAISGSFARSLGIGKTLDELKNSEWATTAETRGLIEEIESLEEQITRFAGYEDSADLVSDYQMQIDELMGTLQSMDRAHTLDNISASIQKFAGNFQYFAQPFDRLNELQIKINGLRREQAELTKEQIKAGASDALEEQIQKLKEEQKELNAVLPILEAFKSVWEAVLSVIKLGKEIVSSFIEGFKPIKAVLSNLIAPISNLIGSIGRLIKAFNNALVESGIIKESLVGTGNTIADFLSPIVEKLAGWIDIVTSAINKMAYNIENGLSPISGFLDKAREAITKFFDSFGPKETKEVSSDKNFAILDKIKSAFSKFVEFITPLANRISSTFGNLFKNLDLNKIFTIAGGSGVISYLFSYRNLLSNISKWFKEMRKSSEEMRKNGPSIFGSLQESIDELFNSVSKFAKAGAFLQVAIAIGILAVSLNTLSKIKPANLAAATGAVTAMFIELFGAIALFEKFGGNKTKHIEKVTTAMTKIASAVLVLSKAVAILGALDTGQLEKGVIAIGVIMLELTAYSKLNEKAKGFNSGGIIILAAGLWLMSKAVESLGKIDTDVLIKGIKAMGAVMLELAAFANLTKNVGGFNAIGVALGITIMAGALFLLGQVVKSIGKIDADVLKQGLLGLAGILVEIGVALAALSKADVLKVSASFLIMSVAIAAITASVAAMGMLGLDKVKTGLIGIGGALAIVGVVLGGLAKLTKGGNGLIKTAAAITLVAVAMNLLAIPLALLGAIGIENVVTGLVGLGGALLIVGVASKLLEPLAVAMLKLSGNLLVFGIALTAAGVGIAAFATALRFLAAADPRQIAEALLILGGGLIGLVAIASLVQPFIGALLSLAGTMALIGVAALALGFGLSLISSSTITAAQAIGDAIVVLVEKISEQLPAILSLIGDMIVGIINTIGEKLPEIIESGVSIAIGFIGGLAQGIVDHTDEALGAMEALVNSLVYFALSALQALVKDIPVVGDDIAGALEGVKNSVKEKVDSAEFEEAGKAGGDRLDRGLNSKKNDIKNTGISLSDEGITGVLSKENDWGTSGTDLATLFGDKVFHEGGFINSAGVHLGEEGSEGIDGTQGLWSNSGNYTVDGLYESLMSQYNQGRVYDAGYSLGGSANAGYNSALMISSPSRKMMWSAEMTIAGLVKGFDDFGYRAAGSGTKLGEGVLDAISTTLSTIDSVMDEDDFNPVISPVLDLTNVEQGAGQLDTLLASRRIGVTASMFGSRFADPATAAAASGNSVVIQNLTVNGTENMDVNELSDAVIDKLNRQIASENSRWAY